MQSVSHSHSRHTVVVLILSSAVFLPFSFDCGSVCLPTVGAFVLLCNSRYNFHCYTQCEAMPTQKLAWKWCCDLLRLLAQKITKGIHSCKPASLNCPIEMTVIIIFPSVNWITSSEEQHGNSWEERKYKTIFYYIQTFFLLFFFFFFGNICEFPSKRMFWN